LDAWTNKEITSQTYIYHNMIPAPKGVKPIEIVSKSKIETKEQMPAPEGVVPIEEPGNTTEPTTENELDKKVEEFEEKIQEVKTSETYRRALEELNSLVDNVKNSTVTATEKVKLQYNLWVLRNKLEEKNPTSKPQSVRNDLSQTYKSCTGFNQLGCKSESIKKVQECLGLEPTGNFDNLMYNKLGNYGWQNGFNDSDVNRVCDLIKKTIEMNIQIEKQKKEAEDFYRKFPKTSRGSEILDLS
jgi:antitoxin component HigA of HigAB toxin-antitoxin module